MSEEKKQASRDGLDSETATAIVTAIVLHRASVEGRIVLLENGERDEGFWGRSSRAGTASVLVHSARRH